MTTWVAISSDDYGATTRVVATGDTLESAWLAMYERFDEMEHITYDDEWAEMPNDQGIWCYEERSGWNGWILPLITDQEREEAKIEDNARRNEEETERSIDG